MCCSPPNRKRASSLSPLSTYCTCWQCRALSEAWPLVTSLPLPQEMPRLVRFRGCSPRGSHYLQRSCCLWGHGHATGSGLRALSDRAGHQSTGSPPHPGCLLSESYPVSTRLSRGTWANLPPPQCRGSINTPSRGVIWNSAVGNEWIQEPPVLVIKNHQCPDSPDPEASQAPGMTAGTLHRLYLFLHD